MMGSTKAQILVSRIYAVIHLVSFQLSAQYSKAALGIVWVILTPALFLAVYLPVLTYVFKATLPGAQSPYDFPLFMIVGYLAWMAFSDGFLQGASSIAHNPSVIQNSPAPPILLPVVKVTAAFVGLAITLALYLVIAACLGRFPGERLLLLPVAFGIFYVFTLGAALIFASIAVYVRDVLQLLPTLLLIEFFACPIVYASSLVAGRMALALAANPLTPLLAILRASLAPVAPFAWMDLGLASAWACVLMLVGWFLFRRLQDGFSDAL
jgi:ABC-type polysaccharide/polyol phosphate export permease